jgi:hypothetical protein
VLGVAADADSDTIKRAYLDAARRYHPDALADVPDADRAAADARMREVNAAWSVLRNPVRRRDYDRRLRGDPVPPWQQRPPAAPRTRPVGAHDVRQAVHGAGATTMPAHGGSILRYWWVFVLLGVLAVVFVFTAYAASTDDDQPATPAPVSPPIAFAFAEGECVVLVSSAGRIVPVPADCTGTGANLITAITDVGRPCAGGAVPFDLPADERRLCLQEQ